MRKVSTLNEFERLIGYIVEEGPNFISPIMVDKDNLDIFKVYEKTIELASDYFTVKVTLTEVPFSMKFDLVSFVIIMVHGDEGISNLLENIYSTPFDSDSRLLTEIKNDYKVCTNLANIGCLIDNYKWPYLLLDHMYKNINNIPRTYYSTIIRDLSFLFESLGLVIQKKLFNDVSKFMDYELVKFTFSFMKDDDSKKQDTITYQRLSLEYPEVLDVYQRAVDLIKLLQIRNSILM